MNILKLPNFNLIFILIIDTFITVLYYILMPFQINIFMIYLYLCTGLYGGNILLLCQFRSKEHVQTSFRSME